MSLNIINMTIIVCFLLHIIKLIYKFTQIVGSYGKYTYFCNPLQ